METYALIILMGLFLGVMGIIAMLDQRRRRDLEHFEHLHQTLAACLGSLQAIHSSNEAQLVQMAEALSQVRIAIETGTKSSSDSAATLSNETAHAVEKAVVRLESTLLQQQKAQDAASHFITTKFSDVTQSTSKEMLAEIQRTTKAVLDLKASLEESVNFNRA